MNIRVKVSKDLKLNALLLNRTNKNRIIMISILSSNNMLFFRVYVTSPSTKLQFHHVKTTSVMRSADAMVDGHKVPLYLGGNLTYSVLNYWHDSKPTQKPVLDLNYLRLFKDFDLNSNFLGEVNKMLIKFFSSQDFINYHKKYIHNLTLRSDLEKKRNKYLAKAKAITKKLNEN